jgi:16S rRNA U516 pseudouridylate synthase RsuA-like enzyme
MEQKQFVFRQKFNNDKNSSRTTIVGLLDSNNVLKIAGAKCSNRIFNKKEGVVWAAERAENSPWVQIPIPENVRVTNKLFYALSLDVLNKIDFYLDAIKAQKEVVS